MSSHATPLAPRRYICYVKAMQGRELQNIRKAARLTQEEFGQLVDHHRTSVSDWERGDREIPAAVELIARLIDDQPELLIKLERWRGMRK
ncbi:MAG: helix-turn-helix domain-containing protein [Rhodomicrobium sp.]